MGKIALVFVVLALFCDRSRGGDREIKEGDIIFQTSLSSQSEAIRLATKSEYSHAGLIFEENGKFYVFEAVKTVRMTPLETWIKRGKNGEYAIKRLKNADDILNAQTLSKLKETGKKFSGRDYDLAFEWSDEKIYCSELVWKIYAQGANIEIGKLQKLGDFDLSAEPVKLKLKERYGERIPLDEVVISPAAIFNSDLLDLVEVCPSDCR
ncbi:MAG: YiiX family permuted papain-like enzyme [Helicobacteraceae bacterium]|nr:YiiX family permuted papain-like enzyme [Helicobacteraceae bacterium]